MSGYEQCVFYKFEAAGKEWYVTEYLPCLEDDTFTVVDVEEVRKNSQEDDHKSGSFVVETGEYLFGNNLSDDEESAIITYLQDNPLPAKKSDE